jgi:hypothetical protein
VILDLEAESQEVWRSSDSFYGATFIECMMDDFGGTNGLFGDITDVANRSALALADAPSFGGVGISMEGIYQNAPYYTAVLQHAFQPAARKEENTRKGQKSIAVDSAASTTTDTTTDSNCPNCCKPKCLCTCCCPVPEDPPGFNTTNFLVEWGLGRCGTATETAYSKVEQAWVLLAETVYRPGQPHSLHRTYCSTFAPGVHNANVLKPGNAGVWFKTGNAGPQIWTGFYPNVLTNSTTIAAYRRKVFTAWQLLTDAAGECNSTSLKFDIADVGREYINIAPCLDAFDDLVLAWNHTDATRLVTSGNALIETVLDIDELLASQQGFLLGEWIQESRAMGHTESEKALMELNARAQVTTWTPLVVTPKVGSAGWPVAHNINGYAEKTWAGLSRLSHAPRLQAFVSTLSSQLRPGKSTIANLTGYVQEFINLAVKFENEEWDPKLLPATEVGSTVEIAKRLQAKYKPLH